MTDIILTQDECQAVLNELAGRDPVMRLLMQKQAEAQARDAEAKRADPPNVVGVKHAA